MMPTTTYSWAEANHQYLLAALTGVGDRLRAYAGMLETPKPDPPIGDAAAAVLEEAPPALERLSHLFGLSAFEQQVLLICAGMELDAGLAALCTTAQGASSPTGPTFSLALAAFPEAHWSALSPDAPLRYWRLIEVGSGSTLVHSPLRIDERILHYLTGVSYLDEHLVGFVRPVHADRSALVPSHEALVARIEAVWGQQAGAGQIPVIQLTGPDVSGKRNLAAAACARLGLRLFALPVEVLPTTPHEFEMLVRLWEREAALSGAALLVEDEAEERAQAVLAERFLEQARGVLLVSRRERHALRHRPFLALEVRKPTAREQRLHWQARLGTHAALLNGHLDRLSAQFDLGTGAIDAACLQAGPPSDPLILAERLWDACRTQARPKLGDLAQFLEPVATWEDLVLPEAQRRTLQDIVLQVRQRARVYETWGFAAKSARGLGISALFHGPSGTGKTTAAEAMAHALCLDLYRIDLSQVVSKYIGETEKNLRRVFDAAEEGGAVLLFDEADALFGRRTEVKDSHDRYANIEVSYLLQRMESYRGLAILTTNLKGSIDDAFQRRIRFMVPFPFPDASQRAEIWRRIFPAQTPTEGLDVEKLARLNVAGGTIRNIALYATFLAADEGVPVQMPHLLRATRAEYTKLEKPLTDQEIRGWG